MDDAASNGLRQRCMLQGFTEAEAAPHPFQQFQRWLQEARDAGVFRPEAMTLATATRDGIPSARMVLLTGVDGQGFCFFTHDTSRKGGELRQNPRAALVFYWNEFERQVRLEGTVTRLSPDEEEGAFRDRPMVTRLTAWVSQQSQVVSGRQELEQRLKEVSGRFPDASLIPRPEHWVGFRLIPSRCEFWQGREDRLHDRLCYQPREGGGWRLERLSP